MRRRLALIALTGIAAAGAAVPALADANTSPSNSLPVGVSVSTKGGVFVGVTVDGRPGVAAQVANGAACVGISLQVPFCVGTPGVSESVPNGDHRVGPVDVYTDTSNGGVTVGTALGSQPLVGASYYEGTACVGFSLEVPFCASLPPMTIGSPRTDTPIAVPVRVWYSTNGGIFVGTAFNAQPLVGASVAGGQACVGFSYEIPFCAGLGTNAKTAHPAQPLPGGGVVFYHDDTRTVVGFNDVGVVIYSDGTICPVVSTQAWRCIPGAGA